MKSINQETCHLLMPESRILPDCCPSAWGIKAALRLFIQTLIGPDCCPSNDSFS
jgi:hypothetical protein